MLENITQELLNNTLIISRKYETAANARGENFNIFSLLKIEKDEVGTHSRLISELLNPKGSHGQKNTFLKLFLTLLENKIEKKINLNIDKIFITSEKFIGKINEEKTEGGRIDIIIDDGKKRIIIENKIDAPDQENQLMRYYNFDNNALIFYLTKFGTNPQENSDEIVQKETLFTLSYQIHIINWLESCKHEVENLPFLREIIAQYIFLIKKITNQNKHVEMNKEINDVIKNTKENFEASMLIAYQFNSVKNEIIETFWNDIKVELENIYSGKGYKFNFTKPLIERCPALFIEIAPNSIIGIEPLNGVHYKSEFNELFIGYFNANNSKLDYSGPYPQWFKCEKLGYHFGEINQTLGEILPNSSQRKEIKNSVINKIKEFIENNETSQSITNTNPKSSI